MKKLTLLFALVSMLMLALGSATAVAGPSGKGATVIDIDTCVPLIGGGTVCVTSKGMINETSTPSGNISFVTNYRERFTVYDAAGQMFWDESSKEHFHALTMDGVLQEMSWRARYTITSWGQTYCVQYHIHGANGADQFVRIDFCD
jgi:hypothetical protein